MSLLIDVRTHEEFEERSAPGAVNISLDDILAGDLGVLEEMPKDTPLHLYCRSGSRSETAQEVLYSFGFTDVANLGGLDDVEGV